MIYVVSDIHGCFKEYMALLEKIHFCDEDELYVLGDVVDRGPEPIRVLRDMMLRPNVYPIIGNHDYIALKILKKLSVEVREDNADSHLSQNDILDYVNWMQDGGKTTAEQFRRLSAAEKEEILEYLQEFTIYEELTVNGKHFLLVHAGLHEFEECKDIEDYTLADLIFYRADYQKRYYSDKDTYLVTGHTPTAMLREDGQFLVYEQHGHVAIDCGCVYGGKLAAYCLNDGTVTYIERGQL